MPCFLLADVFTNPESLFYYFFQADLLGKIIVLMLLVCSVMAWYVMIDKWLEVNKALKSTDRLLRDMEATSSHLVFTGRLGEDPSPVARIHEAGSASLLKILGTDANTLVIHADDKKELFSAELRFPDSLLENAAVFDQPVYRDANERSAILIQQGTGGRIIAAKRL